MNQFGKWVVCCLLAACVIGLGNQWRSGSILLAADDPSAIPGLWYEYYEIDPDLESQTPVESGVAANFDLSLRQRDVDYAFRFTGYLNVPTAGEYTLYVQADADVRLLIDDVLVLSRVGGDIDDPELTHTQLFVAGLHPVRLEYVHGAGAHSQLMVQWSGPGLAKAAIADDALFYSASLTAQLPPTSTPMPTATAPSTTGTLPTPASPTPMPPLGQLANSLYLPAVIGGLGSDDPLNQPPQVALSQPTAGETFASGAAINMEATASDEGAVTRVDFYADGVVIGQDDSAPYTVTWMNAPAGEHTLWARAFDDRGAVTASAPVAITVSDMPDDAPRVYFITPSAGATVTSPVQVEMGAENFIIEPAGFAQPGKGHFHIMIDVGCVAPGETIPRDESHLHFGNGQTSATLELTPGTHTLCLQAGDGIHTALALTEEITITVAAPAVAADSPNSYTAGESARGSGGPLPDELLLTICRAPISGV